MHLHYSPGYAALHSIRGVFSWMFATVTTFPRVKAISGRLIKGTFKFKNIPESGTK
jgi:hypothetical protein